MDGQLSATHDETLSPEDAVDVLEEILEAQNQVKSVAARCRRYPQWVFGTARSTLVRD